MFDTLKKYDENSFFLFEQGENLNNKCNAPNDKSGVYLVYDDQSNKLIYIGRSGYLKNDRTMFIRQGGIKDRLVNGHQFGAIPRRHSWSNQMEIDCISILKIEWYITHNESFNDCPKQIESQLLIEYKLKTGSLPNWNKQGG